MISNRLSNRPHAAPALTAGWGHPYSSKLNRLQMQFMEPIRKMQAVPTKSFHAKILDRKCHFQILQFRQMGHSILNFDQKMDGPPRTSMDRLLTGV